MNGLPSSLKVNCKEINHYSNQTMYTRGQPWHTREIQKLGLLWPHECRHRCSLSSHHHHRHPQDHSSIHQLPRFSTIICFTCSIFTIHHGFFLYVLTPANQYAIRLLIPSQQLKFRKTFHPSQPKVMHVNASVPRPATVSAPGAISIRLIVHYTFL